MSLYGLWMENPAPSIADVEMALQGNLCRCTGYAPIVRAGVARGDYWTENADPLLAERQSIMSTLNGFTDGARVEMGIESQKFTLPADVDDLADILDAAPESRIVAGGTDVGLWVTKFMRDLGPVIYTSHLADFRKIEFGQQFGQRGVIFGGGATYTEVMPLITQYFPDMAGLWKRIGGQQVRNAGTIGGNIANGSPIGDTPPPLMALGSTITLRKGGKRRVLKLEDFFIAYGEQDRAPGEFIERIFVPFVPMGDRFAVYKISKRQDEDISSLCGAFRLTLADGNVDAAIIVFGGMATTPKRARAVEAELVGKPWTLETVERAMLRFADDYQPISDMRASADYRAMTAQNLLMRFYFESIGEAESLSRGVA